jgi:hypothetical protein
VRIVDGRVRTEHILDGAITSAKVLDASLIKGDLAANTLQWAVVIPLMVSADSVAADAVATPKFANSLAQVKAEHLQSAKSAYVVLDYAWAATADGTIQVYDNTALAVIAETAGLLGGESAEYAELTATLANIVAGNDIIVRANVTTAGAAGETATVNRAWLVLVCGAS